MLLFTSPKKLPSRNNLTGFWFCSSRIYKERNGYV